MRVVWGNGCSEIADFVVPTLTEARQLIAEGAINATELLTQAGLSADEAAAEVASLPVNYADIEGRDADGNVIVRPDTDKPLPR